MRDPIPEGAAPGEYIRARLGSPWSHPSGCRILGRPVQFVSELLSGKRSITPETAVGLASAFETDPQLWLTREAAYRLSMIIPQRDAAVEKRARLYRKVPIKEIVDRRWIEGSSDVDVLEARVLKFYGIDNLERLDEPAELNHVPRQSTSYAAPPTPAQRAWFCQRDISRRKCPRLVTSRSSRSRKR